MLFGLGVALESEADYERRYIVLPHVLLPFRFYALRYETFGISLFFFFLSFIFDVTLFTNMRAHRNIRNIRWQRLERKRLLVYTYSFVREPISRKVTREKASTIEFSRYAVTRNVYELPLAGMHLHARHGACSDIPDNDERDANDRCKSLFIVTQRVQRFKSYPEFCSCRTGPLAEQSETCWLTDSRIRIIRFQMSVFGVDRKFEFKSLSFSRTRNKSKE